MRTWDYVMSLANQLHSSFLLSPFVCVSGLAACLLFPFVGLAACIHKPSISSAMPCFLCLCLWHCCIVVFVTVSRRLGEKGFLFTLHKLRNRLGLPPHFPLLVCCYWAPDFWGLVKVSFSLGFNRASQTNFVVSNFLHENWAACLLGLTELARAP